MSKVTDKISAVNIATIKAVAKLTKTKQFTTASEVGTLLGISSDTAQKRLRFLRENKFVVGKTDRKGAHVRWRYRTSHKAKRFFVA